MQNQKKSRNIFLHTIIKISENSDIKHLRWSKAYLSKETKKVLTKVIYEFQKQLCEGLL